MSERKRVWALVGGLVLLLTAGSATIVEVAFALSLNINLAVIFAAMGVALVLLADVLHSWKSNGRLSFMLHTCTSACAELQDRVASWFRHVRAIARRMYASYTYLRRHVIRHMVDLLASYIVRHHPTLAAAVGTEKTVRENYQRAIQAHKRLKADSSGGSANILNKVVEKVAGAVNTLVAIDDKLGRMEVALEQTELLLSDLLEIARQRYGKDVPSANAPLHKAPDE